MMIPLLVSRYLRIVVAIFLLISVGFSFAELKRPRIVGGKPAAPGAWPFMASIFMREKETSPAEHMCGSVIWNEDTILTAAHCLIDDSENGNGKPYPAKLISVLLGQTDISSPDDEYTFQASELLIHPAFNSTNNQNDVGLIKLGRAIDFAGKHSKAGCVCDPLPVSSLNGSACLALGWGVTNPTAEASSPKLMQVDLPLISQDICADKYNEPGDIYNSSANVCAGYMGIGGKDTCGGDSGGPLLCQLPSQPSEYSLVGLTSFGPMDCGSKEAPGYYTKVETYLEWIGKASGE